MSISQYRLENKDRAIKISMEKIMLTAAIHQHGIYTPKNIQPEDLLIVVKKIGKSPTYSLICGWADYMEAKAQGLQSINCIVTEENRTAFMHRYNNRYIKTDSIIIPECFAKTTPSLGKIKAKTKYYDEHGKFKNAVKLNRDNILVDGYINYLIAKEKGIKRLFCKMV